jgi:hypothetical protein
MFQIIESTACTLYRPETAKVSFALPLGHTQLCLITDNAYATLYNLATSKIERRTLLPSPARKAIVLSSYSLALLLPEQHAIFTLTYQQYKHEELAVMHKFEATQHHLMPKNLIKEREYYSTMLMESFLVSGHLFIREENPDYRKICLKSFYRVTEESKEWLSNTKELGYACRKIAKFDERDSLVLFKDTDIERAGMFTFQVFNVATMEEEEVVLQSQCFTEFTIVVEVKQHEDCIFVMLNRKDPELLCFRNRQEHSSTLVKTNVLWMATLGPLVLDLAYSLNNFEHL